MDAPQPFAYTVVIPAYNSARWIHAAVDSASAQMPSPVEIIVVDDGSTDGTADLVADLPLVRIVRRANGGEAAARNTGLHAAGTRWVSFLDADDEFVSGRHVAIAEYLARHDDVAVVATDALVVRNGVVVGTHFGQPSIRFAVDDQRSAILDANFLLSHVVCDRNQLLALDGFDEQLEHACDWDMWIRFIMNGGRIGLLREALSRYTRHDDAMTGSPIRVTAGDIAVWTKTRAHRDLTAEEQQRIDHHLRDAHALLVRHHLKQSLATSDGHARRHAAAVVGSSDQPLASRVKAVLALISPVLGRRLLRSRGTTSVDPAKGVS